MMILGLNWSCAVALLADLDTFYGGLEFFKLWPISLWYLRTIGPIFPFMHSNQSKRETHCLLIWRIFPRLIMPLFPFANYEVNLNRQFDDICNCMCQILWQWASRCVQNTNSHIFLPPPGFMRQEQIWNGKNNEDYTHSPFLQGCISPC